MARSLAHWAEEEARSLAYRAEEVARSLGYRAEEVTRVQLTGLRKWQGL